MVVLFPGPNHRDPERYAASLISNVASGLGGRFFDELRDKRSLAYTVHVFSAERQLAGAMGAYIATSPEKEEAARAGLLAEFARLCAQPITAEELDRAKTYAMGVHAIRQQSGGSVLAEMVDAWLFGELRDLIEYDDRIRAVTAERMRALSERWFDPERRVEGVVRGVDRRV